MYWADEKCLYSEKGLGEGKREKVKVNGVGKGSGRRMDPQSKEQNGRLWDEGKKAREKMNGVGGVQRLRTDTQRKEQKWGV